jgi:prepilin-type processing-associated H-X9-DG protein
MKISFITKRDCAMTLIEVLVVTICVVVLVALVLPGLEPVKDRDYSIVQCRNNLKQVGLSFRVWASDNNDKYPMELSDTNGGTREFATGPNEFRHFQVMSNELSTPKVVTCYSEIWETSPSFTASTTFGTVAPPGGIPFGNSHISYFVGVDANQANPRMILSGDRNLTNGIPINNGILELTTSRIVGWTSETHVKRGNILFVDGSVQVLKAPGVRKAVASAGIVTNRLQMPILGP